MLNYTCMSYKFEGTFKEGCKEFPVPDSLVALVSMILDGANTVVIKNLLQHRLHSA